MKETNQLKAGVILSYLNLSIGMVVPLLYTPIMLRLMGQAEYGLYQLSNTITGYLSLLSLGMGNAILRYLMKYHAAGDRDMFCRTAGLFQAVYGIIAGLTVLVGVVLTRFTDVLFAEGLSAAEIQKMNILLLIMAVGTGLSFLGSVYNGIIYCHERHIFQKVVGIVGTIVLPVANLVGLYLGYASIGLAVIGVTLSALTQLLNVWYCYRKLDIMLCFRQLPWYLLKEIIPFSLFLFLSMVADMLFWAVDKVFIGALMGTAAVAVYNIGVTFQSIMQNMNGAISGVFAPRVNAIVFSGKPISENSDLLIRIGRVQYLILSLILSGFVVFGKCFLALWAGAGYEEAYTVALLTMFPMCVPLIQNVAFNTLLALNRHQFRSVMYITMAVINAVSTYLLIPVMGIIGAALCTCIVVLLGQGLILNIYYNKKIGLDIARFWTNILKLTVVPAALATAMKLISFEFSNIWKLLIGMVAYTGMFCVLSWLFSMNQYEKGLILGLVRKLLPRKDK